MNSDSFSYQSSAKIDEYEFMKSEIEKLRTKNNKYKTKYREIKKKNSDLTLQNQILEDEKRVLTEINKPYNEKVKKSVPMVETAKVSELFSDFETIFASQSREISDLLNNKDSLSTICFKLLAIVGHQDLTIQRFYRSINKFVAYLENNNESLSSVHQDFLTLGIDLSHCLRKLEKKQYFHSILGEIGNHFDSKIEIEEIERVLNSIPNSEFSSESMSIVTKYLLHQIQNEKISKQTIRELREKYSIIETQYLDIISELPRNGNRTPDHEEAVDVIRKLKDESRVLKNVEPTLFSIIEACLAFGAKLNDDPDIQRCISRVNLWKQNGSKDVDIAQEIDFLLGLCYIGKDYLPKQQQTRAYIPNEEDMKSQIQQLKITVADMRQRIKDADMERLTFIQRNFNGTIPLSAQWTQICEHLINRRRSK